MPNALAHTQAIMDIHYLLNAREWGSDTLERIAEILIDLGYPVNEPKQD